MDRFARGRVERAVVLSAQVFRPKLQCAFDGFFVAAGGFDRASAEKELADDQADMIAFGRPLIANRDLIHRLRADAAPIPADGAAFYTPGAKGDTDYPALMR